MKQINDLRIARQVAEQQRDDLMLRAQQLQSKTQENAVSGIYDISACLDTNTMQCDSFNRRSKTDD